MFQSIHYQRHEMFAVNMVYVVCHITLVKHIFVFAVFLYLCVCIILYLMHNLCIDIFLYFVWPKMCALKALPSIQYLLCVTQHLWNSLLHRWQQMSKNWLPSIFLSDKNLDVSPKNFPIPNPMQCSAPRPKSTGGKSKLKFTSRIRSCPRPPRGAESSDWSDIRRKSWLRFPSSWQSHIGWKLLRRHFTCQMELGGKPRVTYASLTLRGEGWLVAMHQMQIIMKACNEPKSRGGAIVHQLLLSRLSLHLSSLLRLTPLPNLICFDSCFADVSYFPFYFKIRYVFLHLFPI